MTHEAKPAVRKRGKWYQDCSCGWEGPGRAYEKDAWAAWNDHRRAISELMHVVAEQSL